MALLQAVITLWPIIRELINLYLEQPPASRAKLLSDLKGALAHAKSTGGDTSGIESLIRRGR